MPTTSIVYRICAGGCGKILGVPMQDKAPMCPECRPGVAQLGSASDLGSEGRRFKSGHSDQASSGEAR